MLHNIKTINWSNIVWVYHMFSHSYVLLHNVLLYEYTVIIVICLSVYLQVFDDSILDIMFIFTISSSSCSNSKALWGFGNSKETSDMGYDS